jgi:hypothetical protein
VGEFQQLARDAEDDVKLCCNKHANCTASKTMDYSTIDKEGPNTVTDICTQQNYQMTGMKNLLFLLLDSRNTSFSLKLEESEFA